MKKYIPPADEKTSENCKRTTMAYLHWHNTGKLIRRFTII